MVTFTALANGVEVKQGYEGQERSSNGSVSTKLRLRWEYQPGRERFVVYNDQRDTELRSTPMLENRAFVVKFTRLFRF